MRKFLVPVPRALDNPIERLKFGLPAKLGLDFFRRGNKPRWITRAAWFFDGINVSAGNFATGVDHFANA